MCKLVIEILVNYHILIEYFYTYTAGCHANIMWRSLCGMRRFMSIQSVKCAWKSFSIITIEINLKNRVKVQIKQNISW